MSLMKAFNILFLLFVLAGAGLTSHGLWAFPLFLTASALVLLIVRGHEMAQHLGQAAPALFLLEAGLIAVIFVITRLPLVNLLFLACVARAAYYTPPIWAAAIALIAAVPFGLIDLSFYRTDTSALLRAMGDMLAYVAVAVVFNGFIATNRRYHQVLREKDQLLAELQHSYAEAARMNGRLQYLASTDELTGLTNYRSFQQRLLQVMPESELLRPVGLWLLDMDQFKQVNHRLGHLVGDGVLRDLAERIKRVVGDQGEVFRYGEEEFAVLLPGVGPGCRADLLESIRETVRKCCFGRYLAADGSQEQWSLVGGPQLSVTVGQGYYPDPAKSHRALLKLAEEDLHRQKRAYYQQLEDQRVQAEKLATIGQLAAGLAHEIRNPLTSVRGFLQLLRLRPHIKLEVADLIIPELDRINRLVGDFLLLARPSGGKLQPVVLEELLSTTVALLRPRAVSRGAEIVLRVNPGLPPLMLEGEKVKQVIINVINNALEAMPEPGPDAVPRTGCLVITAEANDSAVVVSFRDNGVGIGKEHLQRIFDPFFTTKREGTGLGLAISRSVIQGHGGQIAVQSQPGSGTSVSIRLPLAPVPESGPLSLGTLMPEGKEGTVIDDWPETAPGAD